MTPCLLLLTSKNKKEADNISNILLSKKLVSCIKITTVNSSYLWKNKIEKAAEILMIIDSIKENFHKVDQELKKIHSYETYTLIMMKVENINKKALDWINSSLK